MNTITSAAAALRSELQEDKMPRSNGNGNSMERKRVVMKKEMEGKIESL